MPFDLAKYRAWARIPHDADDPALLIAWQSAVREMEERTGWCVETVTRTQYVATEPTGDTKLVLAARQPVTTATCVDDNAATITLSLVTINGLQYFDLDEDDLTFPLVVTLTAGGTVNPLLEMALLNRVTQHAQSRGDDTVTLSSDYWDRVTTMMGKGIG
jgi:hypothetical protein